MEKNYLKVSALNNYIKMIIDENTFLHKVYIKGEISNFKNHTSGHLYFTLKDEESRINAIMFRSRTIDLKFTPEDGKKVLIEGRVSCYPSQGTYQVYVDKMEEDGLGNLYILYEQLKKKLKEEGLFAKEHKKEIPKYPKKIGIVTAPTGAAIKDILSTIKRRYPICETILFPSLVQGPSAAPDIVKQINKAQNYDLDVLIIGRGGGSIEDLWAFNDENVARAIYHSQIPIISAVGHEIDYTISDFVADLRAPTPTGAAEMAVPTLLEVKNKLNNLTSSISYIVNKKLLFLEQSLQKLADSYILKNPIMLYDVKVQKLDYQIEQLQNWWKQYLTQQMNKLKQIKASYILKNPLMIYQPEEEKLKLLHTKCNHAIEKILEKKQHDLKISINTVKLVNPLNILEKGYSLVTRNDKVIKKSQDLKPDDIIFIKMKEGSVTASIKEVL